MADRRVLVTEASGFVGPHVVAALIQAIAAKELDRPSRLELEREAEYCVGEDLAMSRDQEITSDRSACAAYDEPPDYPH